MFQFQENRRMSFDSNFWKIILQINLDKLNTQFQDRLLANKSVIYYIAGTIAVINPYPMSSSLYKFNNKS